MGVYKTIDDVPPKYQLSNHAARYDGDDVWEAFLREKTAMFDSTSTRERYEKAGRYFTEFMGEQGRHHAIADPDYIQRFSRRSPRRRYRSAASREVATNGVLRVLPAS